jgi:hypothetical protein
MTRGRQFFWTNFSAKDLLHPIATYQSGIETVKWIAVLSMTIDHINRVVLDHAVVWMFEVGRLALPLFCLAFGSGIARRLNWKVTVPRLMAFGIMAQLAWLVAGELKEPNILFGLALAVVLIALYQWNPPFSAILGVTLGFGIEGSYGAIALVTGAYNLERGRHNVALIWMAFGTWFTCLLSASLVPALAVPLFLHLRQSRFGPSTRSPHLLYWYYPTHLLVLAAIAGRASTIAVPTISLSL